MEVASRNAATASNRFLERGVLFVFVVVHLARKLDDVSEQALDVAANLAAIEPDLFVFPAQRLHALAQLGGVSGL